MNIDESDNSLSTSDHLESVTRSEGSITSESGFLQVRVDWKRECRDVELEKVNLVEGLM